MKEEIILITLQVTLVAGFLVVFFFSYASTVENEIVTRQVNYLVDSFTGSAKSLLDPATLNDIKSSIDSLSPPDLSQEDQEVEAQNLQLENKSVQIVMALVITGILIYLFYLIYSMRKGNVREAMKMLLIIGMVLTAVAITEVTFLNLIAKKYLSADPNYFRGRILSVLNNFVKNPTL